MNSLAPIGQTAPSVPLQVYFETVPWWLPILIIVAGVFLYAIPYLNRFIGHRLSEWRSIPLLPRVATIGLLVSGAGLVVFTQLGDSDWMYVLFLFAYTRAIEGATVLHLLGRIDKVAGLIASGSNNGGSLRSKLKRLGSWAVKRLLSRLPLLVVTVVLSTLALIFLIAVLLGFPGTPITIRVAAVLTITTFALSTVNTAWVLRKVRTELGPPAFLGVICCVVGGELYSVPAAFSLFPEVPALDGPFSAWTTVLVGLIGWLVGLILAVLFFIHRIRQTNAEVVDSI